MTSLTENMQVVVLVAAVVYLLGFAFTLGFFIVFFIVWMLA